ncbi:MAG: FAD-dependent oxidoreductase [Deltaproteobacteria bacterium]|nr:FAD-dependent oxidoreductase [Deltaproteobacteria bacterium]
MFDRLFTPLALGKTIIPNRVCFLAHRTNFSKRGELNEKHLAYYTRRAKGGCGLIILGELCIHPDNRPWGSLVNFYDPSVIRQFRKLTNAIHSHGSLIFAQLIHHGFQSSGAITRKEVWGPSANSDISFGEVSKPMEIEDIHEVIEAFANAALIAGEAGFDGVEIDMGAESLIRQFLSPLTNHREDEYGGNLNNRMRFATEVLEKIKSKAGEDFAIGVRLCVDEKFWGAITPEESKQYAKTFEERDLASYINTTVGTYYSLYMSMASMHTPPGFAIEAAELLKKNVRMPVIASHQITSPNMAEDILEKGQADAVGFIRNLICDPDMIKKAKEGRIKDIRYCVRDNKGCIGRVNNKKQIGCIQNPEVGFEGNIKTAVPGKDFIRKRVVIIGGGPAGLEAARRAAERGHDVKVFEKEKQTGGQINLIKKRPRRQGMGAIITYLMRMAENLKIPIITGIEVTVEMVLKESPDAVIVATGSYPRVKPVPGNYAPPFVLNVWEVLQGEYPIGENILFIDENGGHHAAATVEYLADQGKKVHMVTSDLFIGIELSPLGDLSITRQRLLQKGVTFASDLRIEEIIGIKARFTDIYTNMPVILEGYDTIILDMGNRADDRLYMGLKGKIKELYRIGDCVAPRGIDMAFLEARRVGEII